MGEPEWTKSIPNETVCNYYYYLSVAILIIGGVNIAFLAYFVVTNVKLRGILLVTLVSQILMLAIAYYIYLFAYLTCTRSLVEKRTL